MRVVALGGGHGLAASLAALRHVADDITAVVTVADNGGSSGRIREEFGTLPPGDLRMALAALCGDDEWGRTWADVLQHRFSSAGEMDGHAVGNLLIVALWELLAGDEHSQVAGLSWVGRLLRAQGRVLPMALTPLDITARVALDTGEETTVRGQVQVATTPGRVLEVALDPPDADACPEAVAAVRDADWVVIGPGSWFSSVIPHLLVPALCDAVRQTSARLLINLNLTDQPGETDGLTPAEHLDVLVRHAPGLVPDVVLADRRTVDAAGGEAALREAVAGYGGRLELHDLASEVRPDQHDPEKLSAAYARSMGGELR